jgi:hypothetical protein
MGYVMIKIDSKISGIETFSGGIVTPRTAGVLVKLPADIDLKKLNEQYVLFIRGK